MIVVFQEQHIPALPVQLLLPGAEGPFQLTQMEFCREVVLKKAVGAHDLVLDHHVDLLVRPLVYVFERNLRCNHGRLRQGHTVVLRKDLIPELSQILMDVGAVIVIENALVYRQKRIVRQALFFGDKRDHVLPEAVHPFVQPEAHDFFDFLTNQWIVHIEVRLLYREQVQIVFPADRVKGPCLAFKVGIPVVGQLAVILQRAPDIIIRIGIDPAAALLEPFVFVTGVVDHQIHDHLHSPVMGFPQTGLKGLHAAELGIYVHVVRNIVAAIRSGGRIQGGKPDSITAQALDIIQFLNYTVQIAHAIAVSVPKAPGPDLIKHGILIPIRMCHRLLLIVLSASAGASSRFPARIRI